MSGIRQEPAKKTVTDAGEFEPPSDRTKLRPIVEARYVGGDFRGNRSIRGTCAILVPRIKGLSPNRLTNVPIRAFLASRIPGSHETRGKIPTSPHPVPEAWEVLSRVVLVATESIFRSATDRCGSAFTGLSPREASQENVIERIQKNAMTIHQKLIAAAAGFLH